MGRLADRRSFLARTRPIVSVRVMPVTPRPASRLHLEAGEFWCLAPDGIGFVRADKRLRYGRGRVG